jgi:hypothetical protein
MEKWEKDLPNWESFESELQALRLEYKHSPSRLLFRGLSDSAFSLSTTLERSRCDGMWFGDYYRLAVNQIKPAVETFTGVIWDVPDYGAEVVKTFREDMELLSLRHFPTVPFYRYMVYLRHHGFPSPLLDWTYSPYVAAFFAFRDSLAPSEKRSIYVYCEMPKGHKGGAEPTILPIGPYVRSHRRHFRQQSDYTICARFVKDSGWRFCSHDPVFRTRGEQDFLWKFNLPSTEGIKVSGLLNDYNLNAFSLFDSEETLLETLWFREQILRKAAFSQPLGRWT